MAPVVASDNSGEVWTAWQTERNGNWDIYAAVREVVGTEETPVTRSGMQDTRLCQNFPNPFGPEGTTIELKAKSEKSKASLRIYDVSGRLVKILLDNQSISNPQSSTTVFWDGKDNSGRMASAGIYFCRLAVSERGGVVDYSDTKRMVLVR